MSFKIDIASPCNRRWEDMVGDERVRFCAACQKNVFNISSMNAGEAQALFVKTEGKMCGRVFRRADDTVLTADCPVGLARARRHLAMAITAVAALFVAAIGFAANAFGRRESVAEAPPSSLALRFDRARTALLDTEPIKTLAGEPPVVRTPIMGKMVYVPPMKPVVPVKE